MGTNEKTKVVYNGCFGGFSLSDAAVERYEELTGEEIDNYLDYDHPRHDPALVTVVEQLGSLADGGCASLCITEIPGTQYRITNYDGAEGVETPESIGWVTVEPGPIDV